MADHTTVDWLDAPEDHDYPAAESYLSLLATPERVATIVTALKSTLSVTFKAKDLLRAARLDLLPAVDVHVASDLKKIHSGKALSPVLLVRGGLGSGVALQVADGYHRICAGYLTDENTDVTCRIVD